MKTTLQYISAKTLRMMDDGRVGLQGTGTIIQSHERYYLLTAYHCLGKVNEKGEESIPADWHKMSAKVFTDDSEFELSIIGLGDVDQVQDWAVLEIEKPQNEISAKTKVLLTGNINYPNNDVYAAYGFPRDLSDGIYMEFTPTNNRGMYWRIHDTVEGGNMKAISIEKGSSGMGLFRKQDDKFLYLGMINKSVPNGAMNAMQRIPSRYMAKCFDDILEEDLRQTIQSNPITENDVVKSLSTAEALGDNEQVLCEAYTQCIMQANFDEAVKLIERLFKLHPDNENIILNYIHTQALADKAKLAQLESIALTYLYSTPENVAFVAKIFATNGYPQTALDILYNNAMRMNDPVLDSLYYAQVVTIPMLQEIARKEYDEVEEGKCVLYSDEQNRRHCWMVSYKSEMGKMLIGHRKNETIEVCIAGEKRNITLIAIFDKYFSLEHRALADVMEHGGNKILTPLKIREGASGEETLQQLLDFLKSEGPAKSIEEQMKDAYKSRPCLMTSACSSDLVPSFYFMLFTDFQLCSRPAVFSNIDRFRYINDKSEFVLDLSSFLTLSEEYFQTGKIYRGKFIISKYLKAIIENFCNTIMFNPSFLMHQVLTAGRIHVFADDAQCNMELRIEALHKFISDFCVEVSVPLPKETIPNAQCETSLLFLNTVMLLQGHRVLITEDWGCYALLQGHLLGIDTNEFLNLK